VAEYSLRYPSVSDSEERMLDDLDKIVCENEIEAATAQPLKLAVSEAFTNALIHGNRQDCRKLIRIDLRVNECEVTADIADQGHGGLKQVLNRRPPAPLAENGRGIDLIRHTTTAATFWENESGGLVVSIRLKRNVKSGVNG